MAILLCYACKHGHTSDLCHNCKERGYSPIQEEMAIKPFIKICLKCKEAYTGSNACPNNCGFGVGL